MDNYESASERLSGWSYRDRWSTRRDRRLSGQGYSERVIYEDFFKPVKKNWPDDLPRHLDTLSLGQSIVIDLKEVLESLKTLIFSFYANCPSERGVE